MKVLRYFLIVVLIFSFSTAIFAASSGKAVTVKGKVFYKETGKWQQVTKGLKITPKMKLKLNSKSACIIQVGSEKVSLKKKGVYPMMIILKNPASAKKMQAGAVLNSLVKQKGGVVSSVAGVRADESTDSNDDPLMLDDPLVSGNAITIANYFLKKKQPDFKGAILGLTDESIGKLSVSEKGEAYYIRGMCQYQIEEYENAIGSFDKAINENLSADQKGKTLILQAMTYSDMAEYTKAVEIGEKILNNSELSSFKKEALSICYTNSLMLGDDKADDYMNTLKSEYPDIELDTE